jgi:hypothetical protein
VNAASAHKHRKLIGIVAVAVLIFSVPYVMEYLGLDVLRSMFFSPILVVPACIAYFLFERYLRAPSSLKGTAGSFIKAVVLWALAGIGIALVGVIAMTATLNSPQGPLALIFYGPAALAIGSAVGTVIWRISAVKPNSPLQGGPTASGRPLS